MLPLEQLKALLPDHAIEGIRPIQHYAPVPNDCGWVELACFIGFGAALLTHGAMREFRFQVEAEHISSRYQLHYRWLLAILCMALGALVGMQTWDAILGLCIGAVGSLASPLFVAVLQKLVSLVVGIRNGGGGGRKPG